MKQLISFRRQSSLGSSLSMSDLKEPKSVHEEHKESSEDERGDEEESYFSEYDDSDVSAVSIADQQSISDNSQDSFNRPRKTRPVKNSENILFYRNYQISY